MPQRWEVLPYLVYFLITAAALFFLGFDASHKPKLALWLIPITVSGAALIAFLQW